MRSPSALPLQGRTPRLAQGSLRLSTRTSIARTCTGSASRGESDRSCSPQRRTKRPLRTRPSTPPRRGQGSLRRRTAPDVCSRWAPRTGPSCRTCNRCRRWPHSVPGSGLPPSRRRRNETPRGARSRICPAAPRVRRSRHHRPGRGQTRRSHRAALRTRRGEPAATFHTRATRQRRRSYGKAWTERWAATRARYQGYHARGSAMRTREMPAQI
jgi:hypothetical protein